MVHYWYSNLHPRDWYVPSFELSDTRSDDSFSRTGIQPRLSHHVSNFCGNWWWSDIFLDAIGCYGRCLSSRYCSSSRSSRDGDFYRWGRRSCRLRRNLDKHSSRTARPESPAKYTEPINHDLWQSYSTTFISPGVSRAQWNYRQLCIYPENLVPYRDLYQRWSVYFGVLVEGREIKGGEAASQGISRLNGLIKL